MDSAFRVLFGRPAWSDSDWPADDSPFVRLPLRDEDEATRLAHRLVSLKAAYEWYASAPSVETLCAALASMPREKFGVHILPETTFSMDVEVHYGSLTRPQQNAARDAVVAAIGSSGRVDLRNPMTRLTILVDCDAPADVDPAPAHDRIARVHLCRRVADGRRRDMLKKYDLRRRVYLGPTSTPAELALYMAGQALAAPGKKVIDPFVGTGSILVAAAHFGAVAYGSDIDFRVLHGFKKDVRGPDIFSNFEQYGLPRPELMCADLSLRSPFRGGVRFDGIVCDPPYGVRAGARKTGAKDTVRKPFDPELMAQYDRQVPRTCGYAPQEVMDDLFRFAALRLTVGGRLVFLLPTHGKTEQDLDSVKDEMPVHRCLRIICVSKQTLRENFFRLCVTVEKVSADGEADGLEKGTVFFGSFATFHVAHRLPAGQRAALRDELASGADRNVPPPTYLAATAGAPAEPSPTHSSNQKRTSSSRSPGTADAPPAGAATKTAHVPKKRK